MRKPVFKILPSRFSKEESGAALVEFAILLPMMLLVFAVIIEGGRLMWSYQSVNAGVRDAARYLARVAPANICRSGGTVARYQSDLETIVRETVGGDTIFPSKIIINSVTPSLICVSGSYRISPAPVVEVNASMTIQFPFSGMFDLNDQTLGTMTKTVSDQSRVFGT